MVCKKQKEEKIMLTILFFILFFAVFGGIIKFAFMAAWGLLKVLVFLIFLPLILIGLLIGGLVTFAIPILAIVGIVFLVKALKKAA